MPFALLEQSNHYASTPEQKIFYIEKGDSKEAIFFIHGWHQNARDCFGPYLDNLQHEYKIFAIDLPGHGKSYKVEHEEYSHSVAYASCKQVLNQVAETASNITVIGHSLGAFLALKLALLETKKINNLVLISPVIDYAPYEKDLKHMLNKPAFILKLNLLFRAMSDKYPFFDRKHIYRAEVGHRVPSKMKHYKFKMKNHPLHCAIGYMRSFIGCSLMPLVKNNHLPTLLLYGADDDITPAEFGSSLASLMPRTQLRVLQGAAHNVHLSEKEEVMNLITSFIEEHRKKFFAWRNLFRRKNS